MSVTSPSVSDRPHPLIQIPATWDAAPGSGRVVHDPLGKVRTKYLEWDTVLSLEYDLYPARRACDPGWADRLEGVDLAVTMLMNSRVDVGDLDAIFANRQAIEAALSGVPSDLDLGEADLTDDKLRDPLLALFAGFRVGGVSVAKATKVLCLNRPKLIPMLDGLVRDKLYDESKPTPSADPSAFAELVLEEMVLFQRLMLWPTRDGSTNLRGLSEVAEALTAEVGVRMIERGMRPPIPMLTPVRMLDNLLWIEHDDIYPKFGYVWDESSGRIHKPQSES